jgi:hypothetical protein
VEEILVTHSERLDTLTLQMETMVQTTTQLTHVVEQAHEQHDRRIQLMEEVQRDARQMLQIVITQFTN